MLLRLIEIFYLTYTESLEKLGALFRADTDPRKTDLLVGVFKTDEGKAHIQGSVKEVRVLTMIKRAGISKRD